MIDVCDRAVAAAVLHTDRRSGPVHVRARPDRTHPLRPAVTRPPRPRPPRRRRSTSKPLGDAGRSASANSPTTGPRPSNRPISPRRSTTPSSPVTAPSPSSHPTKPSAGTPKPSNSPTAAPTATRANGSSCSSDSASPNAKPATPPTARRSSTPPTTPTTTTHVDLLVRAALANNRGWNSALGGVDHERIAVIDRALERLEPDRRPPTVPGSSPSPPSNARTRARSPNGSRSPNKPSPPHGPAATAPRSPRRSQRAHDRRSPTRPRWRCAPRGSTKRARSPTASTTRSTQYWAHEQRVARGARAGRRRRRRHPLARTEEIAARVPDASMQLEPRSSTGLARWAPRRPRRVRAARRGRPRRTGVETRPTRRVRHLRRPARERADSSRPAPRDGPAHRAGHHRQPRPPRLPRRARARQGPCRSRTTKSGPCSPTPPPTGFPMPDDTAWSTGIACWARRRGDQRRRRGRRPLCARLLAPYHDQIVTRRGAPSSPRSLTTSDCSTTSSATTTPPSSGSPKPSNSTNASDPHSSSPTRDAAWAALLADRGHDDDHDRARDDGAGRARHRHRRRLRLHRSRRPRRARPTRLTGHVQGEPSRGPRHASNPNDVSRSNSARSPAPAPSPDVSSLALSHELDDIGQYGSSTVRTIVPAQTYWRAWNNIKRTAVTDHPGPHDLAGVGVAVEDRLVLDGDVAEAHVGQPVAGDGMSRAVRRLTVSRGLAAPTRRQEPAEPLGQPTSHWRRSS